MKVRTEYRHRNVFLILCCLLYYAVSAWGGTTFNSIFDANTHVEGTAVDPFGNIYIAGYTTSLNFPVTAGAFQKTFVQATCGHTPGGTPIPCPHGFVAKINPSGTQLLYATYLGGELQDQVSAITPDAAGNAYVTGQTDSTTFPITTGAWQPTLGTQSFNGFIAKLKPDGSGLVYSTYLPGAQGAAMAVDTSGNTFVVGAVLGTQFPTTPDAFQSQRFPNERDAFVLKLNAAGTGLIYSTLIGGTYADVANTVAIDSAGNAYVAGYTASTPAYAAQAGAGFVTFPNTAGALYAPGNHADVFVTKVNPAGTALVYSSVFGGGGDDSINTLAIDASGAASFGGLTYSADWPVTTGAIRNKYGQGFLGKLSSDGAQLTYSTFLAGSVSNIAVDSGGNVLAMGMAKDAALPTTPNAMVRCFPTKSPSDYGPEPYVVALRGSDMRLLYSSFANAAIEAMDGAGVFYLADTASILTRLDIFAPVQPGIRCLVNAVSFRGNAAIAPGEIVSIFGMGIGPAQPAGGVIDASGNLATTLEGLRLLIGGMPAPLLYVASDQINAIVPFGIAGQTQTSIQVETNGVLTLPGFPIAVTDAAPGVATQDGSGFGPVAALNEDGTVNSADNPAPQGSTVSLFVTGIGAMQPTPHDGSIPAVPTTKPASNVQVSILAIPATVLYVGDAPGLVEGVVQINAVVPKLYQTGAVGVNLSAGNAALPIGLNVTIFAR